MLDGINYLIERLSNKDGVFFLDDGMSCNCDTIELSGNKCGWVCNTAIYKIEVDASGVVRFYKTVSGDICGEPDVRVLFWSPTRRIKDMIISLEGRQLQFMYDACNGDIICERFDMCLCHVGREIV